MKEERENQHIEVHLYSLYGCHEILLFALNCLTISIAYALWFLTHFHSISFLLDVMHEFTHGDWNCSLSEEAISLKKALKISSSSITNYCRIETIKHFRLNRKMRYLAIILFIIANSLEKSVA
jgi:hypothetical protein